LVVIRCVVVAAPSGWNNEIKSMTTDFCYEDKKGWAVGVSVIMRVTLVDGSYHEDIGFGASVNARSRGDAIMQAKKVGDDHVFGCMPLGSVDVLGFPTRRASLMP
jgi:Rad52/22 family double-strand break repair protein